MLLRWCCFDLLERGDVVRESSSFNREGLLLGDGNPAKNSSQRRSREISEGWTATEERADKRKEDEIQGAGGVEGSVDLREIFERDAGFPPLDVAWIMSAPTKLWPLNYDEGNAYENRCKEENTLVIVESTIPTNRNIVEVEIKCEGGNTHAMVKNIVPTITNTMEEVITMQQLNCSWADLPQELLSLIQSHLFVGDRVCFRAVCRKWRCSQAPLLLDSMDYLMMTSSPCLIFSAMNNCNINLFYPMYNFTYTLKLKEELYGVEICFAKDGWLLLV
ncbi:uncharacterized protein LOC122060148 isoform X1 [Macadamia integrifolia]|uniref:uncharacterized protein LOC122060148 isoform X1 n=1 Tax=Macadamia integrifolia TaxID=60698 RepID=UPI001C52F8EB|nr:uncharacterized protein LOC122060148 isoform X1 [Macadamia integrifolia]